MPTNPKTLDNMTKHQTQAEIDARQVAEERCMPTRMPTKPPAYVKSKSPERKLWDKVLKDMDGLDILDLLDTDALGIYCSKVARWQALQSEYLQLRKDQAGEVTASNLKLMVTLSTKLQSLEDGILTYASKLGLTPESRARLARKQAEQSAAGADDDLFA